MVILPTSFWPCHSKLIRPIKSAPLKSNPFYQMMSNFTFTNILRYKQECIPVECILSRAVAIIGGLHPHPPHSRHPPEQTPPGAGTPQSRHPPKADTLRAGTPWPDPPQLPPWVWALTRSPQLPLGCGPGPDPPQLPPWVWAWSPPPQPDPP